MYYRVFPHNNDWLLAAYVKEQREHYRYSCEAVSAAEWGASEAWLLESENYVLVYDSAVVTFHESTSCPAATAAPLFAKAFS